MGDDIGYHLQQIDRLGYTIVEGAVGVDAVDELLDGVDRLEQALGTVPATNAFEGTRTTRVYNLLAHGPLFEQIPVWPTVLPICEGVLDPGLLVSSLSSISIGPGESAQPVHADDQVIPLPKPHPALVCNTMWALTDFTEANGATPTRSRFAPRRPLARSALAPRHRPRRDGQGERARVARQPVARRRSQQNR